MYEQIPQNLRQLSEALDKPLYLVGGSVRDFLCGFPLDKKTDWDVCSPAEEDELLAAAARCGFHATALYRNTGTVKLACGDGASYEFTRFRSDRYVRGVHVPSEIEFTTDMKKDARRRDFTANAVYYDVKARTFCDPLNGIKDIRDRVLRTVAPASKVFGEDGLRLMRLARFTAQTGFTPDEECLAGATEHAALIMDIAPERVLQELTLLLHADLKHGDQDAPYRGLCILRKTGVLARILPELAAGEGMAQREDFHDYDVLEHSFRCVKYAPPEIRIAALLHDVGKPFCLLRDGNFYDHPKEGARIAEEILTRLKAPLKLRAETKQLVLLHMRDYNGQMKESKVRKTIVEHFPLIPRLLMLFQADFSACKDDLSPAPARLKWENILKRMQEEGAPRTLRELKLNGKDVQQAGVPPQDTGMVLAELLLYAALDGRRNERVHLLKRVNQLYLKKNEVSHG